MLLLHTVVGLSLLSFVLFGLYTEWEWGWSVVSEQFVNHIVTTSNLSITIPSEVWEEVESISPFLSGFGEQERNRIDYDRF